MFVPVFGANKDMRLCNSGLESDFTRDSKCDLTSLVLVQ